MQGLIYQFKLLTRNRVVLFWSIIFPLILATFFNLAFSNLLSNEAFDAAKVAIVENQENIEFKEVLEQLSTDDDPLLELQYVSLKEAETLLEDNEIDGYLIIDQEIGLMVNNSGIQQTIIETVVNNYYQTVSMVSNILEINPMAIANGVLDDLGLDTNNFKDVSNDNMDLTAIYFYTLIGMACLFGSMWGLLISSQIEANLSRQGTRINMAPTKKSRVLFNGFVASYVIQMVGMFILLAYLQYGLNVSFGDQTGYIALLMAAGSFVGIALGNVVGNLLKTSEQVKVSVLSTSTMAMSFLSGMMIVEIKYIIQKNVPILQYINPVSLITDGLYSLYYYTDNSRYFINLGCLLLIGFILLTISVILMRKKKYDSI